MNASEIKSFSQDSSEVLNVGELVRHRPCPVLRPQAKILEVVMEMRGSHCGAAGIVDDGGQFMGMLTEREILQKVLSRQKPLNPEKMHVVDIMIVSPVTLCPQDSILDALEVMACHGFRFMPVVNEERLHGIVDIRELFALSQHRFRQMLESKDVLLGHFLGTEAYAVAH